MNSVIKAIPAPCDPPIALGKLSDQQTAQDAHSDQTRALQSQEPWPPGRLSPDLGLWSDGACHGTERSKAGTVANSGASAMRVEPPGRYCGREFSAADLAHIRELLQIQPALSRVALLRRVCQDLGWLNALGRPKEMSCRVALLRMEKDASPTPHPAHFGLRPQQARAGRLSRSPASGLPEGGRPEPLASVE